MVVMCSPFMSVVSFIGFLSSSSHVKTMNIRKPHPVSLSDIVAIYSECDADKVQELNRNIGLQSLPCWSEDISQFNFALQFDEHSRLALREITSTPHHRSHKKHHPSSLSIDFLETIRGRGSMINLRNELLLKACGIRQDLKQIYPPSYQIWDMTAGLGQDSMLLWLSTRALGSSKSGTSSSASSENENPTLVMFEKNVIVASLLNDALKRLEAHIEAQGTRSLLTASQQSDNNNNNNNNNNSDRRSSSGIKLVSGDSLQILRRLLNKKENEPCDGSGSDDENKDGLDSVFMEGGVAKPDVIYLDPMFPSRRKSALVKGNMQLLQKLLHTQVPKKRKVNQNQRGYDDDTNEMKTEFKKLISIDVNDSTKEDDSNKVDSGSDSDEDGQLLKHACEFASRRVVVKRPIHGPPLGDNKPSHSIKGSVSRFDVYLT
jgi:hypothetical protein